MEVKILSYTDNPRKVIYASARQCYSSENAYDVYEKSAYDIYREEPERPENERERQAGILIESLFIKNLIKKGHLSPLEHVQFTFSIDGISRACSHQLVRHRIASYSQQSQRYIFMEGFNEKNCVIPPSFKGQEETFLRVIEALSDAYHDLIAAGVPKEDARYLLPNACKTNLVVSMNCRALLNFFEERLCNRAQWEIRQLAQAMLDAVKPILPCVFEDVGAKCKRLGFCPESKDCKEA